MIVLDDFDLFNVSNTSTNPGYTAIIYYITNNVTEEEK